MAYFASLKPSRPSDFVEGAPRGVNTQCWGPDLWPVLHGISFLVESQHAPLVARLVHLLGALLPCKFCRESWPSFVEKMTADSGLTPEEHVRRGTFPRWLYDAHNMVNDKLIRQRLKDAADALAPALAERLSTSASAAVVAAALCDAAAATPGVYAELDKRPTFDCVAKRFYIAGATPFPCAAVWRALLMFTLNYAPDKAGTLVEFLRVLARLVRLVPSHHHTATLLARTAAMIAGAVRRGVEMSQDDVFSLFALAYADCDGVALDSTIARDDYIAELRTRIEVAAAGVCLNGVCK